MAKQRDRNSSQKRSKSPPPRLTQRERKLLKLLRDGKTFKDAGLKAGYTQNFPRQAAHAALKNIARKVDDLWERHGLSDDEFIAQHILPALNADETKFFAHNGKVISQRNVKAWGPRVQMIGLIAKMKGMIKEEQENLGPSFKVVVINAEHRPPRPDVSVTIPTLPPQEK